MRPDVFPVHWNAKRAAQSFTFDRFIVMLLLMLFIGH
jgi:hypothetical protein